MKFFCYNIDSYLWPSETTAVLVTYTRKYTFVVMQ